MGQDRTEEMESLGGLLEELAHGPRPPLAASGAARSARHNFLIIARPCFAVSAQ